LGSAAQLYVAGGFVDWASLFGTRRRVDLPTYAFERQRYWLSSSHTPASVEAAGTEPPAEADALVLLPDALSTLSGGDAEALVLGHVLQKVAVVLGHSSAEAVDPDQEFKDMGFDSLLSVRLSKSLAASTGLKLRGNLVLRYRSPRRVAEHIRSSMAGCDPH
ncbi:acyl carrier protein, partial [Streptomyces lancefieldiae]